MYALISREKIKLPPGTVVRMPGSWQDYRTLCDSRGDSSIPRMKYRNGEILLMSPLAVHGRNANILDVSTYTAADDYLPFNVPEVWLFKNNRLNIWGLKSGEYQLQTNSRYFPEIDLQEMINQCLQAARDRGTGVAMRELCEMLMG